MEQYTIVLFILGVIILLTALAERFNVSSPILLILAGICLSFVPELEPIHIESEIIFLLFLPPLLFDAAMKIPQVEFRNNFQTISSLAFGLVFLTTVLIAVISYYLVPGMTWPLAFLLGSILAATDAVAAIGITKNLGLSHKTSVILEGESLLNDASALVAYKFAMVSVMGATFVWWQAGFTFLFLILGGVLTGLAMAYLMGFLLRIVKNDSTAVNSFMLLSPFVTYLLAEHLEVSGVIAVVVLGFIMARKTKKYAGEAVKKQGLNIWEIIIFLLNGFVFILIGLALKDVLLELDFYHVFLLAVYALVITIAALFVRTWRIFMQRKYIDKALNHPELDKNRKNVFANAAISFDESLIVSLSGMRGIVSLAMALAIPLTLENGVAFPNRGIILFITFLVILYSVIGQGLLLPVVIRRLNARKRE